MRALARRYAGALADVVLAQGKAEEARKDLAGFAALVAESAELRNFLSSPAVSRGHKQGAIEKLLARLGAGKTLRNFLFLLVENRRASLLPQIQPAFEAELHARMGVVEAEVTSARELSGGERSALAGALAKLTGKSVEARYRLDAALIGGTVVRIGSTVYDGSVRQQLERIRIRLSSE